VAVTTTGPGAANAVAATGEAWACHSPVLVIATDIPSTLRRTGEYRGVLHETTDQASFFRPVTKRCLRVERVEDLAQTVVEAGELALQHPQRPVYLEIPTDLLSAQAPVAAHLEVAPQTIRAAGGWDLTELAAAERPLIWVGGGAVAAGVGDQVDRIARHLGAPVLTSYGGRGLLPPDHPHLVPLPPSVPEAGALWDAADVVLVIGSDLDAMNTQGFRQPQPRHVYVVDFARPVNIRADHWLSVHAGIALHWLEQLLPDLTPRSPWFTRPKGRELYAGAETSFLEAVEAALPEDAVVVADMCVAGYWYGAFGRVSQPRGLAYPVGWGTLGFGFPASLGTSLSGRPTLAIVGDGGFLFACGDLATAAQERLPVTVLLVDDGGYGMLRYDFTKDGAQPVGTELEPPDFVALAQAFRVQAEEVTVEGLTEALTRHLTLAAPSMLVLKATFTPPPNSSPNWYRAKPA
jgi:acetolactate synthase-1/2/3 large subunit